MEAVSVSRKWSMGGHTSASELDEAEPKTFETMPCSGHFREFLEAVSSKHCGFES